MEMPSLWLKLGIASASPPFTRLVQKGLTKRRPTGVYISNDILFFKIQDSLVIHPSNQKEFSI
uniref:Uncharacterized protein n=1 Tax=Nelumbo nucifera TaxID=4432 RepID=A0A822XGE0_NELNU|nr:TPA_asm: hypothetical protein HUJ06_020445 [Nelumbo nucifera]